MMMILMLVYLGVSLCALGWTLFQRIYFVVLTCFIIRDTI